jgi:hypothetical protein
MASAGPPTRLDYRSVQLRKYGNLDFNDAYRLYPSEQTWFMEQLDEKTWGCMWDPRLGRGKSARLVSSAGVPFASDKGRVVAVQRHHEGSVWAARTTATETPRTLSMDVGRVAPHVFLLVSGFCSPMTCFLPQLQIDLDYADGRSRRYSLASPYELDFTAQHTSVHPAVRIGFFGRKGGILKRVEAARDDMPGSERRVVQHLHADVVHLLGSSGILARITLTPLERQSGAIVHGITLGTPR